MITFEEAKTVLSPFIEKIETCIADAIKEYNQMDVQIRSKFRKRTKANIINDFMCFNAAKELEGMPGILFSHNRQQFSVFLNDKFRLVFKKLDYRLRSSNIITTQKFQFMNQISAQLPDMPYPTTHIVAGYVWNDLQTAIKDIYITCPNGNQNEWELRISAIESPEVTKPIVGSNEAESIPFRRIFPKENADE